MEKVFPKDPVLFCLTLQNSGWDVAIPKTFASLPVKFFSPRGNEGVKKTFPVQGWLAPLPEPTRRESDLV
jgi:hypothetical protein